LVNFEVPGRRRSTSTCNSASEISSPGGQPSTTQPRAGPWLSPKLVTVKIRPKVLPATPLLSCWVKDHRIQIMRIQQKYASASHRNPRPHKWHARKRLEQRLLGVADLHDQDAVILEVGSRAGKNGPNR